MNLDKSIILFERKESGKIVEKIENVYSPQQFKYNELASYKIIEKNNCYILNIRTKPTSEFLKIDIENFLISELFDISELGLVKTKWLM